MTELSAQDSKRDPTRTEAEGVEVLSLSRKVVLLIASHMSIALQVGLTQCFGVLYLSWKVEFESTAKGAAAIQSIVSSCQCFSFIFGGVLCDRFGCRVPAMFGGALATLGLFLGSWVKSITSLFVAVSITGIGSGLAYTATVVAVAMCFTRHYKMANAITYSGVGTGMLAIPPLIQLTLDCYGWRGSMMISSALMANTCVIGALIYCPLVKKRPPRTRSVEIKLNQTAEGSPQRPASPLMRILRGLPSLLGLDLFRRSYRFLLLCLIYTQMNVANMGYLAHVVARAQSEGHTPSMAAFLLSWSGVPSLLGRLCNGLLISWRISAQTVFALCFMLLGFSQFILQAGPYLYYVISAVVYGFSSGAVFAIVYVLLLEFVGQDNFVKGFSLSGCLISIGVLVGPIFSGWIYDVTQRYDIVFYIQGAVFLFCAVQAFCLRLLKRLEPGFSNKPYSQVADDDLEMPEI